jgi:hypothetical protein
VQLIDGENVKAVVSLNEDYELWLFANGRKVSFNIGNIVVLSYGHDDISF